jgi:hypothetical protein
MAGTELEDQVTGSDDWGTKGPAEESGVEGLEPMRSSPNKGEFVELHDGFTDDWREHQSIPNGPGSHGGGGTGMGILGLGTTGLVGKARIERVLRSSVEIEGNLSNRTRPDRPLDETILRSLLARRDEAFACTGRWDPLRGTIVLRLTIDADGHVTRAEVLENRFKKKEVAGCVAKKALEWTVPETPPAGETAALVWSLSLSVECAPNDDSCP